MYRTIVVGFDGSDHARDALVLGALLARASSARLIAACVYGTSTRLTSGDELECALRSEAQERLRAVADVACDPAPELRTVRGRSPAEGLQRLADREPVDLIVVGSGRNSAIDQVVLGGVPERLLQGAPCAIATAPRGYAGTAPARLRTIGAAYDEGPEARAALAIAAELARATNAQLQAIEVLGPPINILTPRPVATVEYESYELVGRAEDERRLRDTVAALPGVEAVAVPERGDPVAVLTAYSHELDLLVLGSRCYGPLRRALLGSVSTPLVRQAACPLLVEPRIAHESADAYERSSSAIVETPGGREEIG
ncbi:MAG: UspA domain protein [Conexibacter sp.]|nr:UspA domain protein [Conexibacter sp.]